MRILRLLYALSAPTLSGVRRGRPRVSGAAWTTPSRSRPLERTRTAAAPSRRRAWWTPPTHPLHRTDHADCVTRKCFAREGRPGSRPCCVPPPLRPCEPSRLSPPCRPGCSSPVHGFDQGLHMLAAFLVVLLAGPGALALDRFLGAEAGVSGRCGPASDRPSAELARSGHQRRDRGRNWRGDERLGQLPGRRYAFQRRRERRQPRRVRTDQRLPRWVSRGLLTHQPRHGPGTAARGGGAGPLQQDEGVPDDGGA